MHSVTNKGECGKTEETRLPDVPVPVVQPLNFRVKEVNRAELKQATGEVKAKIAGCGLCDVVGGSG